MNFINHIIEPDRLLLSWQLPRDSINRRRMFVAELRRTEDSADLYYNVDTEDFKQAKEKGFKGYPGYPIENSASFNNVLSSFLMRIPPRSRNDFSRFLTSIRIKDESEISDFALLGYSNAILPGDEFTIIHPYENAKPPFELLTLIQGYRHLDNTIPLCDIREGQEVFFKKEPDNPFDSNAISIIINSSVIGYIRRGLSESFNKWLDCGLEVSGNIEKKNGTEEYPKIYIYFSVTNKN